MKTEQHPKPYKLAWLKKGNEVYVMRHSLVKFSIGPNYKGQAWCDVVVMDACHLLLGQPWQYDRKVMHYDQLNTYSFLFNSTKIILLPKREDSASRNLQGLNNNLLSMAKFEEARESSIKYVLVSKTESEGRDVPEAVKQVMDEFKDVFSDELPNGLPPLRQHQVNLVPGATLPHRPHYCMSPKEREELRPQVEHLLAKGQVRQSLSPCVIPALLTPKKDRSWCMCVDSRAINKFIMRYMFLISQLDDLLDQLSGATVFNKLDLKSGYHHI